MFFLSEIFLHEIRLVHFSQPLKGLVIVLPNLICKRLGTVLEVHCAHPLALSVREVRPVSKWFCGPSSVSVVSTEELKERRKEPS